MNKETAKGKMKEMQGQVQRKAGEWTGSKEDQLKGMGKEAEGKMQEGVGKMKDAGREVVDKIRNIGNKQEKDLPEEDYQDARNRKNSKADVVPDRDDEIGEEVA